MDLVAKLPSMEAAELAVLHENAERLARTGTGARRAAAADLIPAIEAEIATRRAAKDAELAERRAAKQAAAKRGTTRAAPKRGTKRTDTGATAAAS